MKRWSIVNSLGFSYSSDTTENSVVTVCLDHRLMRLDRANGRIQFIGTLPESSARWQGESYKLVTNDGFAFVVGAEKQVWRFDLDKLK